MAAGLWTPTNGLRTLILNGDIDFDTDAFGCALFLSTSDIGVTSTTYNTVTNEHANANGYATGGVAVSFTMSGTTSIDVSVATNPKWVAAGGDITARYAALYRLTGNDVLFFCLLDTTPADVTATPGNSLTIDSDGTPNPVFTFG